MPLTAKQKVFVREYLTDMNGTRAAIRAGYSQRNADKIASQLLGKTGVRGAIDKAQSRRAERLELDADWVVIRLKGIYLLATLDEPELLGRTAGSRKHRQVPRALREAQLPEETAHRRMMWRRSRRNSKRRGSTSRSPLTKMAGSTEWHREIEFHWLAFEPRQTPLTLSYVPGLSFWIVPQIEDHDHWRLSLSLTAHPHASRCWSIWWRA